ncbi:MAG: hypothetical protein HZA53_18950 [Planctomycetes bacterium]|nr:hypothetical protein [Planctomycetota bacterium]
MRSWIFRHRLRLRAIYGPRPETPTTPLRAVPMAAPERLAGLAPGECAFKGAQFVIRPMRHGAA